MTKLYEELEFVESRRYFKGYKCLHCGYDRGQHNTLTKACPDDLRKNHPSYSVKEIYTPNVKKPVFVKLVI